MLPRDVEAGEPFHPLGTSIMADCGLAVRGEPDERSLVEADGSICTFGRDDVGRGSDIGSVVWVCTIY